MDRKPKPENSIEKDMPEDPENRANTDVENPPEPDKNESNYYYDDAYGYKKYVPEETEDNE